jgi:hypothetical protein
MRRAVAVTWGNSHQIVVVGDERPVGGHGVVDHDIWRERVAGRLPFGESAIVFTPQHFVFAVAVVALLR